MEDVSWLQHFHKPTLEANGRHIRGILEEVRCSQWCWRLVEAETSTDNVDPSDPRGRRTGSPDEKQGEPHTSRGSGNVRSLWADPDDRALQAWDDLSFMDATIALIFEVLDGFDSRSE